MKYSGIEWIGNIPNDWSISQIKPLIKNNKKDKNIDGNASVLSLTINGVVQKEDLSFGMNPENYDNHKLVMKGDYVICLRDLDGPLLCGVSNYNGCLSSLYFVLELDTKDILYDYFNYIMKTMDNTRVIDHYSFGMRHSYNFSQFCSLNLAYPKINIQQKIVSYLNRKCSEIDALIENENKQIEKLKEYKQAIITNAVTKGIDKNVEYKDSGIEWIGKIPSTFELTRIKYILDDSEFGIKCGPFGSALTGKVIDNGEIVIYGQWNVVDKNFTIRRNTISNDNYESLISYKVESNDILVSMMGTIGKCAIVPNEIEKGIMDSHIIKIRLNFKTINSHFFEYEYDKDNGNVVFEYFNRTKKGSIMDGLNTSIIKNACFVLPPIEDQLKILTYLDKKVGMINKIIDIKNSKLEKLQEYKKSLIYEYVTGKKEVNCDR